MCTNGGSSAPRIMVFRPTYEEMKDFPGFITYMESQGANKAGVAKIIPPKEWIPRANGYEDIELVIPAPISQVVHGSKGLYQQFNIQKKSISVQDFQKLAESEKYRTPNHFDYEDLERKYWRNIAYNSPIYGADVSGSLYDPHVKEFNINHLESILDMVNEDYGIRIEGVNTAYLYFGMWKTTFPWHTEDMDLYSINYLHFGAPKSWYAIPPEHGRRLERLATGFFPGNSKSCPAFLRHKMTIISPAILRDYSIPFNKITQEPGEFMVTFPFGYHAGFNHGFNCAESTNFAMPRWVEYGKRALQCSCRKDGVKISMDVFVKKFQPDRYDLWKIGKDVGAHPEDPSRVSAAPPPTKMELTACTRACCDPCTKHVFCEERRRYRTEPDAFSKRHPISHMDGKEEMCIKEEVQSDDTEIYDMGEMIPETQKKKKRRKKKENPEGENGVKEKAKKKVKKEPNPDKIQIKRKLKKKNGEDPPRLTPFYVAEDFLKSQIKPVKKIIISKKQVPSTASNVVPQFEVKEAFTVLPETPPNLVEPRMGMMTSMSDNSNLMALAQLAEEVGSRMDVSHRLTSNGSGSKAPIRYPPAAHATNVGFPQCQVSLVPINQLLNKVVSLPESLVRTQNHPLHNPKMIHVPSILRHQIFGKQQNGGAANVAKDAKTSVHGDSNSNVRSPQNSIPIYRSLPSAVASSKSTGSTSMFPNWNPSAFVSQNWNTPIANASSSLLNRPIKVEPGSDRASTSISFLTRPIKVEPNDEREDPQHYFPADLSQPTGNQQSAKVHTTSPVSQASLQQQADFEKSLQKETCLYESGHLPQVAHMHQHQKLHKMLHDYARLDSTSHSAEILNLSKKPEIQLEAWAQPLSKLWQFAEPDFEAEKAFNISSSTVEPHCAICTVFKERMRETLMYMKVQLPSSSSVLMPSSVFASSTPNQFVVENNPLLALDLTAPLLQCSKCCVCVHATCYGVTKEKLSAVWKCMRCTEDAIDAACCLCPLRGGALKRTLDGRWAHILCAALVPGAMFGSIMTKEPIDLSKIKQARLKLICMYCHKFAPKGSGVCIQCCSGKCSMSFHVSCAHAAGVIFETSNWPTPVYIICTRHLTSRDRREGNRPFVEVHVGDKAVAKHKNKRYYNCEVQRIDKHVFYAVDFEDGSFSENLFPQDIVSRNCLEFGPPKVNDPVEVQWTDGNRYRAFFKGTRTQVVYTVEFENGSQLQLRREDFFTSTEELPKRVLNRMSSATDGQHTDLFEDSVDGKRTRFVNTKYHSSEVVPL